MSDSEPISHLKRFKADLHSVRATLEGGGTKSIALSSARQKWQRLGATLDQLDWTSLEALDESGSCLGLITGEQIEEPEAVEEIEIEENSALGQLVRAQEMALRHFTAMADRTFDAQNRVIEMLSGQLESQNENYAEAIASAHQYAIQSADAQAALLPPPPEASDEVMANPVVKMAIEAGIKKALDGFGGAKKKA